MTDVGSIFSDIAPPSAIARAGVEMVKLALRGELSPDAEKALLDGRLLIAVVPGEFVLLPDPTNHVPGDGGKLFQAWLDRLNLTLLIAPR